MFEKFFSNLDNKYFDETQAPNSFPNTDENSSDVTITYDQMNEKLVYICYIMRYLYDTAIDAFDK